MNNRILTTLLVTLTLLQSSLQNVEDNKIDTEALKDIAKEVLKKNKLGNIGGIVEGLLQNGDAKQLVDGVLANLGKENSGQLLETLGSLLSSSEAGKEVPKKSTGQKKSNGEANPLELLSTLGSLVGAMQDNGNGEGKPGALLQGLGSLLAGGQGNGEAGAALLQGLGSLLAPQDVKKKENENSAGALLQGLGSLLGAGAGNQGGGALLQGLGALLGGSQGNGDGGLNPELIGNVLSMFADSSKSKKPKKVQGEKAKPKVKQAKNHNTQDQKSTGLDKRNNVKNEKIGGIDIDFIFDNFSLFVKLAKAYVGPQYETFFNRIDDAMDVYHEIMDKTKKPDYQKLIPKLIKLYKAYNEYIKPKSAQKKTQEDSLDLDSLMNIASTFLGQTNDSGKEKASFMDYLPMIMNTLNAFTGNEAKERADSHSSHTWAMPPVLERIHIYFDNFMSSDMGKQLLGYLKEQQAFKQFLDKNGNFDYEKFESLIENHSFRRYWIRQLTIKLVDLLKLMSDKKIQDQYVNMGVTFSNSYLQSAGFPKKALIDLKNPAASLTEFANYASAKYLDASLDTKPYVEPIVLYSKELLSMAQASISSTKVSKELTEKLTDTINMEIIEPITRVNRAYRFAKSEPKCDKYVFCLINQDESNEDASLPNVRKALYKGFSLIAGWFLSSHTGTSYWDLYGVLMEDDSCKTYYNDSCKGFYHEEVKATTEYVHVEL
ncbi:uncharacterized protein LOC126741905 isoform X2 [Anthonomus grandis grandis]|uniref:uncharacterized protein LOC126741905 isoform X2 n=1 Tax=Anthonomus grandis grandis TaxID=2921223 RepID=UPI002166679E|nr:uncharacterized protein LOC126741905 isoform X2 [Anthonomus grandis grandis]